MTIPHTLRALLHLQRTHATNIAMQAPIPVTLLSGFLGAGKTTLLKRIVENAGNFRVAVVVNDVAALNIDSALVRNTRALDPNEPGLVELQNGCVCCTLRADLVKAIADLAAQRKFDAIVVESSGVSEPAQVAETFGIDVSDAADDPSDLDPREARELAAAVKSLRGASTLEQVARLDTCVTVVDAAAFNGDLASPADLLERFGARESGGEAADSDGDRSVAQLLVSQIEFADLIVLNKCDLVSRADVLAVKSALAQLNPGAEIVLATRADVPLNKLLGTGRHDPARAANAAGWLRTLQDKNNHRVVETKEYGICNFVYKARTPFHPQRLRAFLHDFAAILDFDETEEEEVFEMDADMMDGDDDVDGDDTAGDDDDTAGDDLEPENAMAMPLEVRKAETDAKLKASIAKFGRVFRSKGFVWIAGRDDTCGEWGHAGAVLQLTCGGPWMGLLPEEMWPEDGSDERDLLERDFVNPILMDRRQELVFIGVHMNRSAIVAALDRCLVTRVEASRVRANPNGASLRQDEWKLGLDGFVSDEEDPFPKWPSLEDMNLGANDGHDHRGHHHGHGHHH